MKFNDQIVSEITAPNNVPFAPGNNVIGIGNAIPPELAATGILAALIMYNNSWNLAATTPQTKYQYIASAGGSINLGVGFSNNPSTTPTATNATIAIFGIISQSSLAGMNIEFLAINSSALVQIVEVYPTATINIQLWNPAGTQINAYWDGKGEHWVYGANDDNGYGRWQNMTYVNGWGPTASPSFSRHSGAQVRMHTDGVVVMRGVISPGITTSGTYIGNVPAAYAPSNTIMHLCNTASATINSFCLIIIDSAGNITVFTSGPTGIGTEVNMDMSWTIW